MRRVVPQRCMPQDPGFSSLFLQVLMQTLQWLDSPGVEDGPLQAQLKLLATQYTAQRRISDGEGGSRVLVRGGRWPCQRRQLCAQVCAQSA